MVNVFVFVPKTFSILNLLFPKILSSVPTIFFEAAGFYREAQLQCSRLYLRKFQNHFVFLGQHLHFVLIDIFWKRECTIERRFENTLR